MDTNQPTKKQKDFLQFIVSHTDKTGIFPTYREIQREFGYKSPNSVTQNLTALVRKGYVEKDGDRYTMAYLDGTCVVSIDPSVWEMITDLAEQSNTDCSEMIRRLIINEHRKGETKKEK